MTTTAHKPHTSPEIGGLGHSRKRVEDARFIEGRGNYVDDMELPGIGRDVPALQRIARETGLHILASTGWYTQASHPEEISVRSAEALAEIMVREVGEGIAGTGVRAGNIGEIGLSGMPEDPFQPDEEKVLRAAARAQAQTGASMTVHPNAGTHGLREKPVNHLDLYLDILEKEGADLGKVYMSHMGFFSTDVAIGLLERGMGYVSYDHLGHEEYYEGLGPGRGFPRDRDEVVRGRVVVLALRDRRESDGGEQEDQPRESGDAESGEDEDLDDEQRDADEEQDDLERAREAGDR